MNKIRDSGMYIFQDVINYFNNKKMRIEKLFVKDIQKPKTNYNLISL